MTPHYEATLVERFPQENGPPTFVEVGPFAGVTGLRWGRAANRVSVTQFSCQPDKQDAAIAERLMGLDKYACEVWVWRDDKIVAAGPITQIQIQGPTMTLQVPGLAAYFDRWAITPTENQYALNRFTYEDVDQALIVKDLIDWFQGDVADTDGSFQTWGNFGIDTSLLVATGVTRDRTYARTEPHVIGTRIAELGAVFNGFDWTMEPDTRQFRLESPRFNITTNHLPIDAFSIEEASGVWTTGDGKFASHVIGFAAPRESDVPVMTASLDNDALLPIHGRLMHLRSYQDVSRQTTVDRKTERVLDRMDDVMFTLTGSIGLERVIDIDDLVLGQRCDIAYDFGFGMWEANRRITAYTVQVHDVTGRERVALEFP